MFHAVMRSAARTVVLRSPQLSWTGARAIAQVEARAGALPVPVTNQVHQLQSVPSMADDRDNSKHGVLRMVATGAALAAILMQYEPAECVGKRKRAGSVLADDMYEVDHIVARRLEKGEPRYLIHWKGYDADHQTWEPLANLCGFEPDIAAFEARQKKENAEYAQQAAAKKAARAKQAVNQKRKAAQGSSSGNGDAGGGQGGEEDEEMNDCVECDKPFKPDPAAKLDSALRGRRSSPFWSKVKAGSEPGEYICQEPIGSGICGGKLHPGTGPTALKNHFEARHKRAYQEMMGYLNADMLDVGASPSDGSQATMKAQPFSKERKAECDLACARWLVKSARPVTLPERDMPFRAFVQKLSRGAWMPPNHHNVADNILKLSGIGQVRVGLGPVE